MGKRIFSAIITFAILIQLMIIQTTSVFAAEEGYFDKASFKATSSRSTDSSPDQLVDNTTNEPAGVFKIEGAKRNDWFMIDMGEQRNINRVVLETKQYSHISKFRMYVSDVPINKNVEELLKGKTHVAQYEGTSDDVVVGVNDIIDLTFPTKNARYILVAIYEDVGGWINVGEVYTYYDSNFVSTAPEYTLTPEILNSEYGDDVRLLASLKLIDGDFINEFSADAPLKMQDANNTLSALKFDSIPTRLNEQKVSGGYLATQLVKIMGYEVAMQDGKTPADYYRRANSFIKHGLNFGIDEIVTYGKFVRLIKNVIHSDMLEQKVYGEKPEYTAGENYLSKNNINVATGIVRANAYSSLSGGDGVNRNNILVGNQTFSDKYNEYENYLGYKVEVYYGIENTSDIPKALCVIKSSQNQEVNIKSDTISDATTLMRVVMEKDDTKKEYRLSKDSYFVYNSVGATTKNSSMLKPKQGELLLIDNNSDGSYDVVKIKSYEIVIADRIAKKEMIVVDKLTGESYDFSVTNNPISLRFEDEIVKFSRINENDVLYILKDKQTIKDSTLVSIEILRNTVSGTITEISEKNKYAYITINEEKYKIPADKIGTLAPNNHITLYLGMDNYICYFEVGTKGNYGIIVNIAKEMPMEGKVKVQYVNEKGRVAISYLTEKSKIYGDGVTDNKFSQSNLNLIKKYVENYLNAPEISYGVNEIQGPSAPVIKYNLKGDDFSTLSMPVLYNENMMANGDVLVAQTSDRNNLNKKVYDYYTNLTMEINRGVFVGDKTKMMEITVTSMTAGGRPFKNWEYRVGMPKNLPAAYRMMNAYDVDEERKAGFVLWYEEPWAYGNKSMLVTKIGSAISNDGEALTKLYGVSGGDPEATALVSEYAEMKYDTDVSSPRLSINKILQMDKRLKSLQISDIKVGDLIAYDTDKDGEVMAVELLFRGDISEDDYLKTHTSWRKDAEEFVVGNVKKIKGDMLCVAIDTATNSINPSDFAYINMFKKANIYIYNKDTKETKVASEGEICDGDFIYSRTDDGRRKEIVVVK